MARHNETNPPLAQDASPEDLRRYREEKAAAIAKAGSSRRETLAGSAVGFGGGGPDSAGVYTSAEREGMGVEELLNDGQEEVFSRTEVEAGRIEHHVGEKPVTRPVTRR